MCKNPAYYTHLSTVTEVNQTLHDACQSLGLVHYIYIFEGSCTVTEFCQVQNSLRIKVLRSRTLAALLHCTQAGVSQTLWRGTRKGTAELSLLIIFAPGSKTP